MQFDRNKFKDLVHYICATCEPHQLGAVKLHKVLFYADMLFYSQHRRPITGETYRKWRFGPMSQHLSWALSQLEYEGAIEQQTVDYYGFAKKQYTSKTNPDVSRLTEDEHNLIDDMIKVVCRDRTAKEISEVSHTGPWETAEMGEPLPYFTVFQLFPAEISEKDLEWGEREADRIARERPEPAPV